MKIKAFLIYFVFIFCVIDVFCQDSVNYTTKMNDYILQKDYNNALKIASFAKEDDYFDLASIINLRCKIYFLTNDYENAMKDCQYLIDDGDNTTLSDIIYLAIISKKDSQDAVISSVNDIVSRKDTSILSVLSLLSKKDRENIIANIQDYLKNNELSKQEAKPFKEFLCLLYFKNDNYIESYNNSIDYIEDFDNACLYYVVGIIKSKRKEYTSSIAFFNQSIRKGYNNYDVFLNRAINKGFDKAYTGAISDLDSCILINDNYFPYYLRAINQNYLGNFQGALNDLNATIQKNDTFSNAYNYRGIVYANLKEYSFAIYDFLIAEKLDKTTPFVHNNLGLAYEKTGELSKAIQEYELSVKYEPDYFDAYYNLGRVYTDLKQYFNAIYYLKKASKLNILMPDVYYLLGINYMNEANKKKACKYFHQALNLNHTLAQEKIDSYCNKTQKQEKEVKKTKINIQEEDKIEENEPNSEENEE